MTPKRPDLQPNSGRADNPAGVAFSAAVMRAQSRLEELRRAAGVDYRRPGADDSRAWLAALRDMPPAAVGLPTPDNPPHAAASSAGHADQLDQLPASRVAHAAASSAGHADRLDQLAASRVAHAAASTDDPAGPLAAVTATVYPSLAAAFMDNELSAAGRLWFLIRAWDDQGCGFYDIDTIYQVFSGDGSPWHLRGRRRLQQLIKQGAAVGLWTLRNERRGRLTALQMTGPAGVAAALGVTHLSGSPVAVPVADLLDGMHKANAGLFAAAVTLRVKGDQARPTSRAALRDMTGAAASTQRTYIQTANVEALANYVTMPAGDVEARGVFIYHGRVDGRPGRAILARRLPNTHRPLLAARPRGRVRKINRTLNLVTNGARGERCELDKIYYDTAAAAAAAWSKNYHTDCYWPSGHTAAGAGLWAMLEAVNP